MKIAIAGASGLIGRALTRALRVAGHDVVRLVRRATVADDEIAWNPEKGEWDAARWRGIDAVVNLAGENIAAGRWTAARRERILRSRLDATRTLVRAMNAFESRPRVFLSASAVGFYGDRGDELLTEASAIGNGFLSEVCLAWETHAEGAARSGVRTALLRFGTVLAGEGGALGKMRPIFRCGLGGRLGSGRQWMSWIAIDDAVGAILHALRDERCAGALNIVAPAPVPNAEFTRTLGRVLHRPAWLPVPAWALRVAFGRMADDALLASTRAVPEKLGAAGYAFRHPTLESALRAALEA
ncbi:MAG TPA: TIGR01777 family oxidoreductase [Opitutaceae bacterium]|nr:TIGR01777 family oxidoreductase [Opitutaceae bacterium]